MACRSIAITGKLCSQIPMWSVGHVRSLRQMETLANVVIMYLPNTFQTFD